MNSVFMNQHRRKETNNKSVKSKEFTKKVSFFLSSSRNWEIAKRAQLNVLFQNIILILLYLQYIKYFHYI